MANKLELRIPETRHAGVLEHFIRACQFYDIRKHCTDPAVKFRLLIAAVYSCRAMVELMLEDTTRDVLTVDWDTLKQKLSAKFEFFDLIEKIRIHDFHRFGISPPDSRIKSWTFRGPLKLKAKNGVAMLHGTQVVTTGQSTIKDQRSVFQQDDAFFDGTNFVRLHFIVSSFLGSAADAVAEYEASQK